jgi:hypothetical protein
MNTTKKTASLVGSDSYGSALPSWFARQGIPSCSMWGKMEIEVLAWAYVVGMARDGDNWHKLTAKKCYELLDDAERRHVRPYLPDDRECYADWWEMIGEQLKDAAGAFEVGGFAWNRWRFDKQHLVE